MNFRFLNCLWALLLPLQLLAQADEPAAALQVQEIRCSGNANISCEFIRDHLYLKAGDRLDEEEVRNAELRLSALRNFDSVAIHLEKGAQRGQVIVVIDVSENSPIAMEWVAGGSYRMEIESVLVGGRVAHQNLFGEGKFADLTAVARVPLGGKGHSESYDLALRYADPLLFGSRRWYGIASAAWHKNDYEDQYGNFGRLETPQFDLAAGWRFADFSYLTSGISYRPGIELSTGYWLRDGTFETDNGDDLDFSFNLTYGWNSEDDLNFPTQGSTFAFGLSTNLRNVTGVWVGPIQFRKTWSWMDAYWTLKVGGDPNPEYHLTISENQLFAMTYARPVAAGDNVRRGRWYIEPGFGLPGFTNEGRQIYLAGLKAGYRADTRMFGIVDLYFIGTVDVNK
jgi:outer membrane protein assembly factor BamA